jgi:hypothetical protein
VHNRESRCINWSDCQGWTFKLDFCEEKERADARCILPYNGKKSHVFEIDFTEGQDTKLCRVCEFPNPLQSTPAFAEAMYQHLTQPETYEQPMENMGTPYPPYPVSSWQQSQQSGGFSQQQQQQAATAAATTTTSRRTALTTTARCWHGKNFTVPTM